MVEAIASMRTSRRVDRLDTPMKQVAGARSGRRKAPCTTRRPRPPRWSSEHHVQEHDVIKALAGGGERQREIVERALGLPTGRRAGCRRPHPAQ
jgi:hypothetical protein